MHVVLHVVEVWVAVDAGLVALWMVLRARRRRTELRVLIRAAERHANATWPLVAALNSGHAEDPEIRHPLGARGQAVEGRLRRL
jgi:hypothetical protein